MTVETDDHSKIEELRKNMDELTDIYQQLLHWLFIIQKILNVEK